MKKAKSEKGWLTDPVPMRLTIEQYEKLKRICKKRADGTTVSYLVRMAVAAYLRGSV